MVLIIGSIIRNNSTTRISYYYCYYLILFHHHYYSTYDQRAFRSDCWQSGLFSISRGEIRSLLPASGLSLTVYCCMIK